jgi:hypothetical protein
MKAKNLKKEKVQELLLAVGMLAAAVSILWMIAVWSIITN